MLGRQEELGIAVGPQGKEVMRLGSNSYHGE